MKTSLELVEGLIDRAADSLLDADFFSTLEEELRCLHAQIRAHSAADCLGGDCQKTEIRPELADDLARLQEEHSTIIGMLDRVIRATDSMVDKTLEDKDVFVLRCREIVAVWRRHEAEEDRLFFFSVWRDTGGES